MASNSNLKQKSAAWKLFKIADDDQTKAICQLCDAYVTRGKKVGSFTTTNMLKHLKARHDKELQEEIEKEEKEKQKKQKKEDKKRTLAHYFPTTTKLQKVDSGSYKQLTYQEALDKRKIWDINDKRAKIIHKYIGEMIAIDLQPFSVVEDIGFIRFVNHVCPNYKLPSRKYIKENIVQEIYVKVRNKIQEEINIATYLSLTSDGWTASTANLSFLSLTSHWITENFELKSAILRVSPFEVSHTAQNISECLKDTVEQFNIPHNKIHVIVRDNAANMAAGVAQAEYDSLPCFLHTLQLTINDAIFAQRYVKDMLSICKQIVGHFNHSPAAFAKYKAYQERFNLPDHKFLQDVQTRWNSQYTMISRVFEQKNALISYCSDHAKPSCLESNQWKILEKLLKILKQFDDCTKLLSSREATASSIIPHMKAICHFFDKGEEKGMFAGLGSTLSAWNDSFKARFSSYKKDKNLVLATYLDPRFKTSLLENEYENQPAEAAIAVWLTQDIDIMNGCNSGFLDEIAEVTDSSDMSADNKSENEFNLSLDKCISELKKEKIKQTGQQVDSNRGRDRSKKINVLQNEMAKYITMKTINNDENPLQWWRQNKNDFPLLAALARKYLCAPPSSVESERLFSVGGNIYSPKRNRVQAETGEMLMFLHCNLRVLGLEYE